MAAPSDSTTSFSSHVQNPRHVTFSGQVGRRAWTVRQLYSEQQTKMGAKTMMLVAAAILVARHFFVSLRQTLKLNPQTKPSTN